MFVPKGEIDRVVKETGAIPFDAPGVELGHHEGLCSFDSIILKYEQKEPGMLRMAKIIHSADMDEDIAQIQNLIIRLAKELIFCCFRLICTDNTLDFKSCQATFAGLVFLHQFGRTPVRRCLPLGQRSLGDYCFTPWGSTHS